MQVLWFFISTYYMNVIPRTYLSDESKAKLIMNSLKAKKKKHIVLHKHKQANRRLQIQD